jgi:hypothetical protein
VELTMVVFFIVMVYNTELIKIDILIMQDENLRKNTGK